MRVWRILFTVALLLALYFALRPSSGAAFEFRHADKVEHAIAFAALAWLAWRAGFRSAGWVFAGLLLFGAGIEVAQGFTATRTAELGDVMADAAGLALGLAWLRPGQRGRDSVPPPG